MTGSGLAERTGPREFVSTAPRPRRRSLTGPLLTLATYVIAFIFFFPILWTLLSGFKSEVDAGASPPLLFFHPTLVNYHSALLETDYFDFFKNSVTLAVGSTILAFLLGVPAAYSLALYSTKRTKGTLTWVLSTKMMPIVGIIVPIFVIYRNLGLLDTRLGMVLLYAAMNLPLVIWMMHSFFTEVPRPIIEAAEVDGAGVGTVLSRVVLPISVPGLAATGLICLIFSWNEFFLAYMLTAGNAGTLPIYLVRFMSSHGQSLASMSAASTIAIAPVFIAGWSAQRALVRGLTMGAVK
jgi:sorbitol/mannitol transport system permease protein